MAISRPFLLALLGAVLLAATFLAVQNARNSTPEEVVPIAQEAQPEAPAAPAEPASSPVDTLKSGFSGRVDSAAFDARLRMRGGGEAATLTLEGAFERGAANDVPAIELNADVDLLGERFEGGFVAVDEKAYFTQADAAWQVPPEAWDPVAQAVAQGGQAQPQPLSLELHPDSWVRDAREVGEEQLDGVETTHVSAEIDPQGVARELLTLAPTGGDAQRLSKSVKRAQIDVWVGSDGILRRLTAHLAVRGRDRSNISFALDLTGVNEPKRIEAPANARAGLPPGAYGEFVRGFTAGVSGVAGGPPLSLAALSTTNPRRAARAVRAHKKVVIFFRNPRGLDDRAVGRSVRALERSSNAVVLTDHVDAVERYGKLVEDLGVSQTPSVVLIDSTRNARLIEGFIDSSALTQAVADAR